ncbi:unnamed protein product [Vitrella brassicaformis CCMP3155]|uniref:ethanolamine-phosphate cytidylyltransferase n=1 Tax=Vitrella brassicaformis (strain CCMP3155) TaxID=1169540 RepID=A0A0G4F811_VITBC|nr:unnamed protein product [Vitrella brassicaformis CCMP3155]|eukprot:CEM08824.1 unnamed protein product [Vitrella brassicaformis CCMP3155]
MQESASTAIDMYRLIALVNRVREDDALAAELDAVWKRPDLQQMIDERTRVVVDADLQALQHTVNALNVASGGGPQPYASVPSTRKAISIYADGIFDLMHSGHFNAIRQARAMGDRLVVGVVSDEEALQTKGIRPIYTEQERGELVSGCKWVDDVMVGTPYAVDMAFLEKTGCDYVAHGDDFAPCADGSDCYAEPRAAGRLKIFKRTEGISTTRLVSRLLMAAENMKEESPTLEPPTSPTTSTHYVDWSLNSDRASKQSLMSTRRLMQFINQGRKPQPGDTIVYVDGSFDIFHVGHLRFLQQAKATHGTFLLVGLYDDSTVAAVKGVGFPVMNLLERTLNVLAMKVVDEVLIGAPRKVSEYLIRTYDIHVVVGGSILDELSLGKQPGTDTDDPYAVAKKLGIYRTIDMRCGGEEGDEPILTFRDIIRRIVDNRMALLSSIGQRQKKEDGHYAKTTGPAATHKVQEL